MTRDEWILRFIDEMKRLRPHTRTQYGPSKLLHAQAAQAYATGEADPEKAARELHECLGTPPAKREP